MRNREVDMDGRFQALKQWTWRNMGVFFLGIVFLSCVLVQLNSIAARQSIATQKSGGLGAVYDYEWKDSRGLVGGSPGGVVGGVLRNAPPSPAEQKAAFLMAPADPADRKIRRSVDLTLVVSKPGDSAEALQRLVQQFGGYVASSYRSTATEGSESAALSVMVPAARLDEFRTAVRRLALRVQDEHITADDVTRQWVDTDARLRNLRAEEQQYRALLSRATKVSDMVEISDKLADVRTQIDITESEFRVLQRQVEMARVDLGLCTEAQARIAAVRWHPWLRTRTAFRDGLQALADYADSMIAFLFALPAALLWLATIFVLGTFAWRLLRWAFRRLFPSSVRSLSPTA